MNERLISNSPRQRDTRKVGAEQSYASVEQHHHTEDCAAERRRRGLDTGARGWRYVYQTH